MAELKIVPDREWCPLLRTMLAEGHCLDINYQRIGLFIPDVLTDAMNATGLAIEAISEVGVSCPNQPLSPEANDSLLIGDRPTH